MTEYTMKEAAEYLCVNRSSIDYWLRTGIITGQKKHIEGIDRWVFTKAELDRFSRQEADRLPATFFAKTHVEESSSKETQSPERAALKRWLHQFVEDLADKLDDEVIRRNPLIYVTVSGFDLEVFASISEVMEQAHDSIRGQGEVLWGKGFITGPREITIDV